MAECEPGELAEVDFGRLGLVPDPKTGRRRLAWALSVVLVHSRHQYVHVTFSQNLADVIAGLEDAWLWFGGVPRRVALENLKAAVTEADRCDPIFQRTFEDYARHRGFVIDATRSKDPTDNHWIDEAVVGAGGVFEIGSRVSVYAAGARTLLGMDEVRRATGELVTLAGLGAGKLHRIVAQ